MAGPGNACLANPSYMSGDVWITCLPGVPAHGEAPVLVVTFAVDNGRFYNLKI